MHTDERGTGLIWNSRVDELWPHKRLIICCVKSSVAFKPLDFPKGLSIQNTFTSRDVLAGLIRVTWQMGDCALSYQSILTWCKTTCANNSGRQLHLNLLWQEINPNMACVVRIQAVTHRWWEIDQRPHIVSEWRYIPQHVNTNMRQGLRIPLHSTFTTRNMVVTLFTKLTMIS